MGVLTTATVFWTCLQLSTYFTGCAAIKCYVCAPVPEIGETCANAKDTALDDCGSTTDSCHVLFIQQINGATEITRNCGRFRGAFQADNNQCKDFVLANHRNAKLCNCMTDGCNTQSVNPQEVIAQPASTVVPSGGSNKLPIYNPAPGADGAAKSASDAKCMLSLLVAVLSFIFHI